MSQLSVRNVGFLLLFLSSSVLAANADADREPRRVAAAYLAAIEASDLDSAEGLFTGESSIYETGGVEGSWRNYREHHLGPEIDAIESFSIIKQEPELVESLDGSLAFIAWPIEYTITLKDERTIHSKGTVTFLLIREKGVYRIRQLHWSSRRLASSG